ncbi:MAG TPA: GNAT family N-acetyltransferase [Caulobacteraceae bacterium]|jgi:RimJ/RimL family protein N-acetyltransferase|nr:GNAT family N-acetyltransferase [Caulobacteraceae bacterium]
MLDEIRTRPSLETARLALRPWRAADAPRLAELANDLDVTRMTGGMPNPYGLADAQAFLARRDTDDFEPEPHFAIEVVGEGLAGGIGFYALGGLGPEVGYWLGKPFWGRGYATEALKRVMRWTREDWRVRCVVAGHFADNPASGVVLVKAGFLYTGEVTLSPSRARGEDAPSRRMVWLA